MTALQLDGERRWPPAPDINDRQAVAEALMSKQWTDGEATATVEDKMCEITGAAYAVAFNSCTSAIHAAVAAQQTWKVAAPSFTFAGTITGAGAMGRPIEFLDVDPDTLTVHTPQGWYEARGDSTTLLAVDLHGVPHRQPRPQVITDACQSLGTTIGGRHIGGEGTHCWSFSSAKLIAAPDGGAVTTNDRSLAVTLRVLRDYGILPGESRSESEVVRRDGHNWRPSELSMALVASRLARLPQLVTLAAHAATILHGALDTAGLWRQRSGANTRPAWHKIRIGPSGWWHDPEAPARLDLLEQQLNEAGVPTHRWGRLPLHQHHAYQTGQQLRVSHLAGRSTLCLGTEASPPMTWSHDELNTVADIITTIGKKAAA